MTIFTNVFNLAAFSAFCRHDSLQRGRTQFSIGRSARSVSRIKGNGIGGELRSLLA
jgi:hypothetical protein